MTQDVKKKTAPSPADIARRAIGELKTKADPEKAVQSQRYFKEQVAFYGLTTPEIQALVDEIFKTLRGVWTAAEALDLCEILLPNKYFEAKAVAIMILLKFKSGLGRPAFTQIQRWLARDYCDNWAAVDSLCPDGVGHLLVRYPEFVPKIKSWTGHPNRWVKRASAVSFIKLARRGMYLDAVYHIARRLFPVDDDLIEKANGWLLREAGKTDMARLEKFLLGHGPAMPRTTIRYAIERFPDAKRRQLLGKTRKK